MTVRLDWPPDVVARLTQEAERHGMSLDAYLLESVLRQKSNGDSATDADAERGRREQAAARILDIQKRVKPDPEGWTSSDYIRHGRR
jgi:hypothetical protein